MDERRSWDDVFLLLDDVKAMARGMLRRKRGASLQTTALVLSALRRQRLADQDWEQVTWPNRQYFFVPWIAPWHEWSSIMHGYGRAAARARCARRTCSSMIYTGRWNGSRTGGGAPRHAR